jgi:hypothetical protein
MSAGSDAWIRSGYISFTFASRPDMMMTPSPIVRRRGHDRNGVAVDEIAFRMGYLCRKALTFDLEAQKFAGRKRCHSPDERNHHSAATNRARDPTNQRVTGDSAQLKDMLTKRDREYSALFEINSKLLSSYKELEKKYAEAEKELTFLRHDPFQESWVTNRSAVSTVPVSTQGKDALYWHQMCRTIESQYIHAKNEIEGNKYQLISMSKKIKELEKALSER